MKRFVVMLACLVLAVAANAGDRPVWEETTAAIGATRAIPSGVLGEDRLLELIETGEALFTAKFTTLDGAGRPKATQAIIPTKPRHPRRAAFSRTSGMDANACSGCHNDPVVGGAGEFATSTFVAEGFNLPDFDSTDPQFSNERGTNHLFGAGLIELLAREMTADLHALRREALGRARETGEPATVDLETKGVTFGQLTALPDGLVDLERIDGIDSDLVVRPFGQKGVMTSLRQFSVNAMNAHHGMQADERFGARWTGETDFDGDGHPSELSAADVSALVAWQASRPPPVQDTNNSGIWEALATRGREVFEETGCGSCHRPSLPLESLAFADPGPADAAGTLASGQVAEAGVYDLALLAWAKTLPRDAQGRVLVPLFGDLKRHVMTDKTVDAFGNELLSQRFVDRTVFATAELWGTGSTAPYGHRNDMTTLDEAIRAHGGAGRKARDAYVDVAEDDRRALIAFLKSLVILP